MAPPKWKMIQIHQCPCGYEYDPEKGDPQAGWGPGTHFDKLPEAGTCPNCQRARIHFREKKYSVPVTE